MNTSMNINGRTIPVSVAVDWDVYAMVPEINQCIERRIKGLEKDFQRDLDSGRTNEKYFMLTSVSAKVTIDSREYELISLEYYPRGIYSDGIERGNGFGAFLIHDPQ